MTPKRAVILLVLLALALPACAAADPIGVLMQRVVGALGRDDITAFDQLVVPKQSFDWDISLAPIILRYRCPDIEGWSYMELEHTGSFARVRLRIDAHALRAGSGVRSEMPRAWIAQLQLVGGHWYLRSLLTIERDLAQRIVRACPDERHALLESDPDADQSQLLCQIAEAASLEFLVKREDLIAAREVLAFAQEEAQRRGDLAQETVVLRSLGLALREFGRREEAMSTAEHIVNVADLSGEATAIATAHFSRGLARWVNGEDAAGVEDLLVAARLAHVNDDVSSSLKALAMGSHIAFVNRDYRNTIVLSERLEALSREMDWGEGEAYASYSLADVHFALRDFAAARELYKRVLTISIPLHVTFAAAAMLDLANCDFAMGNAALAEGELGADADIKGTKKLADVAEAVMSIGKLTKAEHLLDRALADPDGIDDTRAVSDAFTARARLRLLQGRPGDALVAAQNALRYGLHGKAPLIEWSAWRAEGVTARALRALGRQREARDALENAVALVEQLRASVVSDPSASRYFEDKADLYADLMKTNLALGDVHGAMNAAERLRARTLRDSLSQTTFDRYALLAPNERALEQDAEKRVEAANRKVLAAGGVTTAALRDEREHARLALDRLTDELMERHPELRVRRADFRPSLELPASLSDTAVLEYTVTPAATYLFTVTRKNGATKIQVARIAVTRADLSTAVERLNRQLARRDLRYTHTASRLYDLLLAPVAAAIAAHKQLCIIPDGLLWRLPFQVLTDRDGVDVITRHPVFYAPALSLLTTKSTESSVAHQRTLVAFGNPRSSDNAVSHMRALFRGIGFGALPDAETEVARIASIYGKAQSEVYVGGTAREWTFKREARTARIVHVASHGVIDDNAPLYSALLFAPGGPDGDDGLLEAREVLGLHLDADLVVLSACDTASGRIGAGEGVIGLSWAFLVAGCRTLVVAQSPAESKATAELMVEFHRQLRGGLSPAVALQHAQLALRRDPRFAHPFYWAPFVVVGQGFAPIANMR